MKRPITELSDIFNGGKPVHAKTGRWTRADKKRFIAESSTRQITPTKTPPHARPKARPPTSVFIFDIRAVEDRVLKYKESIISEATNG